MIEDMIRTATFCVTEIDVPIADKSKHTTCTLFLSEHNGLEPNGFNISGFPQVLLMDDSIAKSMSTSTMVLDLSDGITATTPRVATGNTNLVTSPSARRMPEKSILKVPAASILSSRRESEDDTNSTYTSRSTIAIDPHSASPQTASGSPASTQPSLTESLTQHDPAKPAGAQRTNRFWTYIGPQHMARNPSKYSANELQRFAGDLAGDLATEGTDEPQSGLSELAERSSIVEVPDSSLSELDGASTLLNESLTPTTYDLDDSVKYPFDRRPKIDIGAAIMHGQSHVPTQGMQRVTVSDKVDESDCESPIVGKFPMPKQVKSVKFDMENMKAAIGGGDAGPRYIV